MPEPIPTRRKSDRRIARLELSSVILYLAAIAVMAVTIVLNSNRVDDQHKESARNTKALCTFRRDLEARAESSEDFLKTHPNGFAGIDAATIRNGLRNQKATIKSLSGLNCPPPETLGKQKSQ